MEGNVADPKVEKVMEDPILNHKGDKNLIWHVPPKTAGFPVPIKYRETAPIVFPAASMDISTFLLCTIAILSTI